MIVLPFPLIDFCTSANRTPFELHQFVAQYATSPNATTTVGECSLLLDWCIAACHHDTSVSNSILAIAMHAAPVDDDVLSEWLRRRLDNTLGILATRAVPVNTAPPQPQVQLQPPTPRAPMQRPLGNPPVTWPPNTAASQLPTPPPDVWAQVAAQLSQGMANIAAAMNTPTSHFPADPSMSYEEGGKHYDKYQLAIIKGFAHTHLLNEVPTIWPMFQHTKHMDTHKDNIKRKMIEWATAQKTHVAIDRGLYFSNSTMREIISLRFNPGGTTADVGTADNGISILMCRPRSAESKTALKRRELAEDRTRATRTLAEEERASGESHATVFLKIIMNYFGAWALFAHCYTPCLEENVPYSSNASHCGRRWIVNTSTIVDSSSRPYSVANAFGP